MCCVTVESRRSVLDYVFSLFRVIINKIIKSGFVPRFLSTPLIKLRHQNILTHLPKSCLPVRVQRDCPKYLCIYLSGIKINNHIVDSPVKIIILHGSKIPRIGPILISIKCKLSRVHTKLYAYFMIIWNSWYRRRLTVCRC